MGFLPELFTKRCGPGYLTGITFEDWQDLLAENQGVVRSPYWLRGAAITSYSLLTSLLGRFEEWRYGARIRQTVVPPPLFIIGHWRSGTTHLHNLLALDERFAYPNSFQVLHPHTFLCTEPLLSVLTAPLLPERRPMDNVTMSFRLPQEDEFALIALCRLSPYLGWSWPERAVYYDRYLTLRDVPAAEVVRWQAAMRGFVQKLTFKHGRPLLLKSPPHTCRIRLLLDLFPDARFVHLHRNPYAVFQSTRNMFQKVEPYSQLQWEEPGQLDERILRNYEEMYAVYFEERSLIPPGRLHELAYEDLDRDPVGQLARLYDRLQLPDFQAVEEPLRAYTATVADYQKNRFRNLPNGLRRQIARRWRRTFEEWGYAMANGNGSNGIGSSDPQKLGLEVSAEARLRLGVGAVQSTESGA